MAAKGISYTNQSPQLPFGKKAASPAYPPLMGWRNRGVEVVLPEHAIAIPLSCFGGGPKLLSNERRPMYVAGEDGEATLWFSTDHTTSSLSSTGSVAYHFAREQKSAQMFFANRVLPENFASEDEFINSAVDVLTEPTAVCALLNRTDINFDRVKFVARVIRNYQDLYKHTTAWPDLVNGRLHFPKFILDDHVFPYLIDQLVPRHSNEQTLPNFIREAAMFARAFCLGGIKDEAGVVTETHPISRKALAEGFARVIRNQGKNDHNPSAIYEAIPNIRLICEDECDIAIAEVLADHASRITSRMVVTRIPQIEKIVGTLSDVAQAKFYEEIFDRTKVMLGTPDSASLERQFTEIGPLVLALRGAKDELSLSNNGRRKILRLLDEPEVLAYALSTNTNAEFVAGLLVEQALAPEADNFGLYPFLYEESDWSFGSGDDAFRREVGFYFASKITVTYDAIKVLDASSSVIAVVPSHRNVPIGDQTEAMKRYMTAVATRQGAVEFVSYYGDVLGRNREANKNTIDFLFANADSVGQLQLAEAGCLPPQVADELRSFHGKRVFGTEALETLERAAALIIEDYGNTGTGTMGQYFNNMVTRGRDANGAHRSRTYRLDPAVGLSTNAIVPPAEASLVL